MAATAASSAAPAQERRRWPVKEIQKLQSVVRRHLGDAHEPSRVVGLEEEEEMLARILEGVLCKGRSDSCLLVGSHGSGKSLLVQRAWKRALTAALEAGQEARLLTLHGSLHSEPRTASQELLLALGGGGELEAGEKVGMGSLEEEVEEVQRHLQQGPPTVLVLEEMDLFAGKNGQSGTGSGQQSVLYLLFDLLHLEELRLAIVGVTCRVDCLSLLEKRVVSRFSQLQIRIRAPHSKKKVIALVRDRLSVSQADLVASTLDPELVMCYNRCVTELAIDVRLHGVVARHLMVTHDVRQLLRLLLLAVVRMSDSPPFLEAKFFADAYEWQWADAHKDLLLGLSSLELCLVVSMMTFELNQEKAEYNFERTYENYRRFATSPDAPNFLYNVKAVAMKAFENLLECELIRPMKGRVDGNVPKEYRQVRMTMDAVQVQRVVQRLPNAATYLKKWAAHSVMHV